MSGLSAAAAALGVAAGWAEPPAVHEVLEQSRDQADHSGRPHATARLIASETAFLPGRTTQVGVHLKMQPGWHVYWNGRNDTGTPVRITLKVPEGFVAGEVLWPAPVRHVAAGEILDHVYEREVTLLVPITAPATIKPGQTAELSAHVDWVVCRTVCVFENEDVNLSLPVREAAEPSPDLAKFTAARAALPLDWPKEHPPARINWKGEGVEVVAPGAVWLAFYPFDDCSALTNPIGDAERKGDSLSIGLESKPSDVKRRLFGILAMKPTGTERVEYYRVDFQAP